MPATRRPISTSRPNITPRFSGLTLAAQGEGHGLSRLDGRSSLGGAAQRRAGAMHARRLSDSADADLDEFRKAGRRATASRPSAARIPSRRSPTCWCSPIPRARSWRCSSATLSRTRNSSHKGIVPYKLGHVAFHVTDVKHVTKFYCDVLGFRESDWMARLLLVPALRARPSHHQSDGDRLEPALPHRLRAARLGPHAARPAIFSA